MHAALAETPGEAGGVELLLSQCVHTSLGVSLPLAVLRCSHVLPVYDRVEIYLVYIHHLET